MPMPYGDKCPCGGRKSENKVVCNACWMTSPQDLRIRLAGTPGPGRRMAAARIIEHAKARGELARSELKLRS